jgi:GDP-D-glucose phosphorylase
VPKFDYDKFNFTKIDQREILMTKVLLNNVSVSFVINNSPLTKYHVLIVPQLESCLPQILTKECIQIALNIMKATDDKSIRIGYNSPGALASVNHLHMHIVHVEHDLYIEDIVS